ncbi:hypothetical protein [Chitinophaga barathri]|uniref:Uncharacterized protein n=1 Tax=Chitinophaga barathri TaxID=1647451 RepID=A0A3N4MB92_9BACT|nr:hypothetical protein [Chitinophaga barathri]RPD41082.1 hypothetical protein EG028_10355 [Chitinophaga barathri]
MKTKIMLAATFLAAVISCKKNGQPADQKEPVHFKEVTLKLTGDFDVSQSPLGRKAGGDMAGRRVFRDSTIYVFRINSYLGIYGGAFTDPDNLRIMVPEMADIGIFAMAIRKGSGNGLYYTWRGGLPYYEAPIYDTLHNRMEKVKTGGETHYPMFPLTNLAVTHPDDTSLSQTFRNPELDIFWSDTTIHVDNVSSQINIRLKRRAFGLELAPQNFIAGRLFVSFNGQMTQKELTPTDIPHDPFIFTVQEFLSRDTAVIPVRVEWQRPNGNVVLVGEKNVTFRRNMLTKISFSLENGTSANVNPILVDTTVTGVKHVIF